MRRNTRKHRRPEETRDLLARARVRGLTARELAAELGVHPNTVGNWVRRERETAPRANGRGPGSVSFVPVRVVDPRSDAQAMGRDGAERGIELMVDRFIIRLPRSVDADDLRTVLAVLEDERC